MAKLNKTSSSRTPYFLKTKHVFNLIFIVFGYHYCMNTRPTRRRIHLLEWLTETRIERLFFKSKSLKNFKRTFPDEIFSKSSSVYSNWTSVNPSISQRSALLFEYGSGTCSRPTAVVFFLLFRPFFLWPFFDEWWCDEEAANSPPIKIILRYFNV